MHAVQLVDDADGQVAHAARRLLSCSGYPAAGDSSASHRVADSAVCAAEPSAAAQCGALQCGAGSQGAAASFLGKVDARHVLSMLTRSLGLSSPWGRGAAAEDAHHVGDEGAGETREELAWLWREVERQDVSARLAGINAVLVLQRRHATAVQREWGVRQEMQLLIALQRAPGVLEVGSAGRHKLSGFLNQLATHCASVASPVPSARLSATSEAAADDGSLETAWEGRWSVGSLVQAYSELFPSTRAPGCDGWGDGWDTMTVTGEGDGDEDAYLVCARSYAQCLQHALQELARRRASTTDQQQGKEPWRSTLAMIAAAAVHRGTELVWAQRVELAASSGEATRVEAATGDAWGTVGLGGYQGYGASGSLLETERAAASLVLNASNAQLKRQALGAARVKAHLSLLCSLFGRPGTEASGVLQEDGADACGAGCMSGDLLARLLAALVQARNPWIWGVHKEVAEKADDLLQTLTAAYLARACPWASPLASAADADTASPQTSPSHSGGSSAPASISRGKAGRIKCEVVARVMWQQCREALEYEQPPNFLSDTTTTAIPTHVHSNSSSDSSRLKGGEGVATDLPAGACGCVWEWAAAVRGAAFLRASSMLWLAAHLGHAEAWSGNETGLWLGAALALLQQPTYDLKALGARLLVALLRQADRQDVRWNEGVLVSSLKSCLHHQHEPLLSATLEALVLTVITSDGDASAPTGPLGGGAGPLKVLHLLLDQGLRETAGVMRALVARAVTRLYHHLGAHAVSLMGPASQLGLSLLATGKAHAAETLSGLALLSAIVTSCWPRTHAYMRDIVQASLRTVLENRGRVSEAEEQNMNQHVAIILHALHTAHGSKLSKLLAPARAALPAVDDIIASYCLPET
eukprot:Tamp_02967.p1 GENE.Tamp_02967~~Tamp_02967.p1  ORF type:complete len:929 (+),score=134.48 Tamp_02967:174-2789(+)